MPKAMALTAMFVSSLAFMIKALVRVVAGMEL